MIVIFKNSWHAYTSKFCVLLLAALLMGCQSARPNQVEKNIATSEVNQSVFYQDSTLYFAEKTASISLRASFTQQVVSNEQSQELQPLANGYKFQFRSTNTQNRIIGNASIVAGGKKITITDKTLFIPQNQGLTVSISLEDTVLIESQGQAVLGFEYNGESQLFTIINHQLAPFIP